MSIEDKKSSGDPSHPYFSREPIQREEKAYNTRATDPDPAGELYLDPDGLTTEAPQGARGRSAHHEVKEQDETLSNTRAARAARPRIVTADGSAEAGDMAGHLFV